LRKQNGNHGKSDYLSLFALWFAIDRNGIQLVQHAKGEETQNHHQFNARQS